MCAEADTKAGMRQQANGGAAVEPAPADPQEANSPAEEQGAAAEAAPTGQQSAPGSERQESAVLKLKGLPFNTSQEQVHEFFSGFAVKSIAFVGEPDGRPSGLVGCEFWGCACSCPASPLLPPLLQALSVCFSHMHSTHHALILSLCAGLRGV